MTISQRFHILVFCDFQINLGNTASLKNSLEGEGGRDIQYFQEGGEFYMGTWQTLRNHVILSYPGKFMSGYLYFPKNLKDIKDHIYAYIISSKFFFQLMVTVFKENLNL